VLCPLLCDHNVSLGFVSLSIGWEQVLQGVKDLTCRMHVENEIYSENFFWECIREFKVQGKG
jgi:hypothetical protein